jgi:outer membrane receptor protein involved in Fe transport
MTSSRFGSLLSSTAFTIVALSLAPDSAQAQDVGAQDVKLEEIVIVARKREENLQDVPLSVSVVTAVELQQRGIKDVRDLVQQDSSLNFDEGFAPGDFRIVIRGLSPTRGRPNVASLIDGIDISSEAVSFAGGSLLATPRLVDAAQIEIVKGPQSALFGRSAFAGAINYVTKDPAEELEAAFAFDGNDQEDYYGTASVSIPIMDTLGMRLNGLWWDEKGYYQNAITGQDVGGGNGAGGALTVKWEPNESFSAKFRAEYTDDEFDIPAQAFIPFNGFLNVPASASRCNGGIINDVSCPTAPGTAATAGVLQNLSGRLGIDGTPLWDDMQVPSFLGTVPDADNLRVLMSPNYAASTDGGFRASDYPGSDRQVQRYALILNWDIGGGTVSSLTGFTSADLFTEFDADKYAVPGSTIGVDNSTVDSRISQWGTTTQFSQELRFTSDFDGAINFVAGAQYWREDVDSYDTNNNVIANGTLCAYVNGMAPSPFAPACTPLNNGVRVGPYMDNIVAARATTKTERDVDHKSIYGQITWNITDQWLLSFEGRYTDEDNSTTGDDPIELRFTGPALPPGFAYYADAQVGQEAGPSITILCGATGNCNPAGGPPGVPVPNPVPNNPVRGFAPVGSGIQLSPQYFIPGGPSPATCPQFNGQFTCLPAGAAATLTNPGYITSTWDRNDTAWTPRIALQWLPNANYNVYASYAEGWKPGGITTLFSATGLPANEQAAREQYEFEPEELQEYELGAKMRLRDNLIVNLAIFREDFTNKQVNTQTTNGTVIVTRIDNASSAKIDGAELDVTWAATEYLTLSGNVTYLDGEYEDYLINTTGAAPIARAGNCTIITLVTAMGPSPTCQVDQSGNTMEDMPEWAMFTNATYRRPFGDGYWWSVGVDVQYQDERYLEDDNTVKLPSYWLANLRLGLEGRNWTALVYADNLFDDMTVKSASAGPALPLADWRAGSLVNTAPGNGPLGFSGIFAPLFPTEYFANMPDPRKIGLRVTYSF